MTTAIALDSSDIGAIQRLYNQPCDHWTRLADLPFDSYLAETDFSVQNRDFVLLEASRGNNALWEFTPETNNWRQRAPYPTYNQGLFSGDKLSFVIGNNAFAGDAYEAFTNYNSGQFWRYEPATALISDQWVHVANLPRKGQSAGRSFTLNNQGYLATMQDDSNSVASNLIVVWHYDPAKNSWDQSPIFQHYTNNFFELGSSKCFVLNQQAYLVNADRRDVSWRFDPTQSSPWNSIATLDASIQSSISFAVRGYGYYIFTTYDTPSFGNVWKYSPSNGWKRVKDFPGTGNLVFGFVVNNRAYIGTDIGQFWTYNP